MTPSSRSKVETVSRPRRGPVRPADAYLNQRLPSNRFSNMPKPWETDDEDDEFFR